MCAAVWTVLPPADFRVQMASFLTPSKPCFRDPFSKPGIHRKTSMTLEGATSPTAHPVLNIFPNSMNKFSEIHSKYKQHINSTKIMRSGKRHSLYFSSISSMNLITTGGVHDNFTTRKVDRRNRYRWLYRDADHNPLFSWHPESRRADPQQDCD